VVSDFCAEPLPNADSRYAAECKADFKEIDNWQSEIGNYSNL